MKTFRAFLEDKGISKNAIDSKISRVNRIKKEYDIELEYLNDKCEELLDSLTYSASDAKKGIFPDSKIIIRGNYITGFASLKLALKDYIEYLDSVTVVKKPKTTKCFYEGNLKDFIGYVGPKCRNVIQSFTKSKRTATAYCECCGAKKTLQAAHVNGKERNDIIEDILEKSYKVSADHYRVDLDEFIEKFKDAHTPLEDAFYFLCASCHNEYDSKNTANVAKVDAAVKATRLAKKTI